MFAPELLDAGPLIIILRLARPLTTNEVGKVLLDRFGSPGDVTLATFMNIVPSVAVGGMCSTSVKWIGVIAWTVPLQVIVPPEPTEGVVHVKVWGVKETNVIAPGNVSAHTTLVASVALELPT
jgi:hypothetical protein